MPTGPTLSFLASITRPIQPRHERVHAQAVSDARNDLVLHLEEVGDGLVEAFGPEVRSALRFDELHVDAHAGPNTLHAAFEDVAHIELAPDLPEIDRLVLVEEAHAGRLW